MSNSLQVILFITIPGMIYVLLDLTPWISSNENITIQSLGLSFLYGAGFGVVSILLRLIVKGRLWGKEQ